MTTRRRPPVLVVTVLATLLLSPAPFHAGLHSDFAPRRVACADLALLQLPSTEITSAETIPAQDSMAAYAACWPRSPRRRTSNCAARQLAEAPAGSRRRRVRWNDPEPGFERRATAAGLRAGRLEWRPSRQRLSRGLIRPRFDVGGFVRAHGDRNDRAAGQGRGQGALRRAASLLYFSGCSNGGRGAFNAAAKYGDDTTALWPRPPRATCPAWCQSGSAMQR